MKNSAAAARRLRLDPEARVIANNEGLHLVERRGAFQLKGRDMPRLHDRLSPVLDGRFTRKQVLDLVGISQDGVAKYLDGLQVSGVLRETSSPTCCLPLEFPCAAPGLQVHRLPGGRKVAVVLDGAEPALEDALSVTFSNSVESERRLLKLARMPAGPSQIVIESDRYADEAELSRRAIVARHLIAIELGRDEGRRLAFYSLGPRGFELKRRALVVNPEAPLETLAEQMSFIQSLECSQLPLVFLQARFANGRHLIGYGVDAKEVRSRLIAESLGRAVLQEAILGQAVTARPWRGADASVSVSESQVPSAIAGRSLAECLEQVLCLRALRTMNGSRGRKVLVNAVSSPSARVSLLQELLARNGRKVDGVVDDSMAPLYSFHSKGYSLARIGLEELYTEVLLREAGNSTRLPDANALPVVPTNMSASTHRSRVSFVAERMGLASGNILFCRVRGCGQSFRFAMQSASSEEQW